MAKNLVIVESPAKAKTIGKFLGKNYSVMASVGHVRDLPKSKMGVDIDGDFEPQYITIRGKGDLIKDLRKEAKKAEKVILATDPDREGEAIAWHLKALLEPSCSKFERVAFNAITKDVITKAIKEPRDIDMSLVDAQQARRVLDRIVGYSISPLLWAKVRRGLSAGRVQSVATRLICDREEEINAFIPEEYWSVDAELKLGDNKILASYYGTEKEKVRLSCKAEVDELISKLSKEYILKSYKKSEKKRNPYLPFTTSTLQQEAANKLGFSTKKTMQVAQKLYEGVKIGANTVGLITYMRTDSTRIAPEASAEALKLIKENFGDKYAGSAPKVSGKKAQDAHEAIRPSYPSYTPTEIKDDLDKDQFKLYDLIWRRFMASHMSSSVSSAINADFENNSHIFKASGSNLIFDGFLKVYTFSKQEDSPLPEMKPGEVAKLIKLKDEQHFTQAPPRYTEASLVKTMEDLGIGRPSTYAPTISTIVQRGYVEMEKKAMKPTELGTIINKIMKENFKDIVDVEFTANMESKLDEVEASNVDWKGIISDFYKNFEPSLKLADKEVDKINTDVVTDEICELCGANMLIKHGKFGKFMACSNYPDCKNTKPILDKIGVKCPDCEDGEIIKRKTKKFKDFYGCSNFPNCRFSTWHRPTGEKCPVCGKPLVDYVIKSKHEIRCSDTKGCKYKKEVKK